MFLRLLAAFTLIPILELALLIEVGRRIGSLQTIALVLITGVVGAYLAKSEGFAVLSRIQEKSDRGEIPNDELFDGLFVLVGGILLLTPGLVTDLLGFFFLLPASRDIAKQWVKRRFLIWMHRR